MSDSIQSSSQSSSSCSSESEDESATSDTTRGSSNAAATHDIPKDSPDPLLNVYDFSTPPLWLPLKDQPDDKTFLIKRKEEDIRKQPMMFKKSEIANMMDKIAKKLSGKARNMVINYSLKLSDGSEDPNNFVEYDEDASALKESLELLYCQTPPSATLIIEFKVRLKRSRRSEETLFQNYIKKHQSVDETFLKEYLNESIVCRFLQLRQRLRIVFGFPKCINFLNPAYFRCHVVGCPKQLITLRSFNNASSIRDHWKCHSLKDGTGSKYMYDPSCVRLIIRYDHIVSSGIVHIENGSSETLDEIIEELERGKDNDGNDLCIIELMQGKFILYENSKFPDKHKYVSDEVLKKLQAGDTSCLASFSKQKKVTSYFSSS